jgi:hypothetical protein
MKSKRWQVLLAGLVGLVVVSGALAQDSKVSGTVTLESKSVALGVGVTWGDGVLSFQGKTYKFAVSGLTVADLGVAKVSAQGEVKDLKKVDDFAGTYAAVTAGAAAGGGASVLAMKNQHGVSMILKATGQGVRLALASQGLEIKLKK